MARLQTYALFSLYTAAGFCNVTRDCIVIMDAGLQDPPTLLPQMIETLENNQYDNVATRRVNPKDEPPVRSFFARRFYHIINKISDADIVSDTREKKMNRALSIQTLTKQNV